MQPDEPQTANQHHFIAPLLLGTRLLGLGLPRAEEGHDNIPERRIWAEKHGLPRADPRMPGCRTRRAAGARKIATTCPQTPSARKYPCMDPIMTEPADRVDDALLRRAAAGEGAALAELFGRYRKRLRQMVRLRLDRRLQGRVDPSDVLQEAFLDVAEQLPHFLRKPEMSFFLWLRLVTGQRLMRLHRQHLGAAMRDAGREVSLYRGALPQASSVSLAAQLLGRVTTASQAAVRAEIQVQLQAALNGMEPLDR